MSRSLISSILDNEEVESFLYSSLKNLVSAPGLRNGKFFVLFGTGSNGKSTFLQILKSYYSASILPFEFLTSEVPFSPMPYSRASPIPCNKIVIIDESDTDKPIVAARLYDFLNAENIVFYACNTLPVLKGTNTNLWNNIYVIPCLNRFNTPLTQSQYATEVEHFQKMMCSAMPLFITQQRIPQIMSYWTNQLKSHCLEYPTLPTFVESVAQNLVQPSSASSASSASSVATDPHPVHVEEAVVEKENAKEANVEVKVETPKVTKQTLAPITILLERNPNLKEVLKVCPDPDSDGFLLSFVTPKNRNETMYVLDDDTLESYIQSFFEFLNYEETYSRIGFRLPMMPDVWMPASRVLHYIKTMFPQQLELLMLDWPLQTSEADE